jgi:serine/threonine-protein kinase RsbW
VARQHALLREDNNVTNRPDVELRLPAESAYVAVLRMTTAGLAARLDFTLDDIEDLRMAVGEACALVLESAAEGGDLHARYVLGDGSIRVSVAADSRADADPDPESFGWQVLTALTSDVETSQEGSLQWLSFTVRSSIAV